MSNQRLSPKFYVWYAAKDLFEAQSKRTTWSVIATLAALQSLIILLLGLTLGFEEAQKRRIQSDPLALTLFAGSRMRPDTITPEKLERLRSEAPKIDPDSIVSPIERVSLQFRVAGETKEEDFERLALKGRSLAKQSTILRSLGLAEVSRRDGIFVTPQLLENLGFDSPPAQLRLLPAPLSPAVNVNVIATTKQNLADGYQFLVDEDYYSDLLKIKSSDQEKLLTEIKLGPIPEACFEWRRLSDEQLDEFQKILATNAIHAAPKQIDDGQLRWEFKSRSQDGLSNKQWNTAVDQIKASMTKSGFDFSAAKWNAKDGGSAEPETMALVYDSVEVVASNMNVLVQLAKLLDSTELSYDRDIVDQLTRLSRLTWIMTALLSTISLLVVSISIANIYTILSQRADQKEAEIGILKSMGMSSSSQILLYFVEGLIFWAISTLIAQLASLSLGWIFQTLANSVTGEVIFVFLMPWWLDVGISLATCIISSMGSVLASSSARNRSPAESLLSGA